MGGSGKVLKTKANDALSSLNDGCKEPPQCDLSWNRIIFLLHLVRASTCEQPDSDSGSDCDPEGKDRREKAVAFMLQNSAFPLCNTAFPCAIACGELARH